MKVSTDACLLGAWAPFPEISGNLLDIGAGTGLLSLMLAQRFPEAHITALEIDLQAAQQAAENIRRSPFNERIEVVCGDVRNFAPEALFDGIIANPPFFQNSLKGQDAARNRARHSDDTLDFPELYTAVTRLLKPGGSFALLLPVQAQEGWEKGLISGKLQLAAMLKSRPLPEKEPNRVIYFYRKGILSGKSAVSELSVYERYGDYSLDFRKLLQPFYERL